MDGYKKINDQKEILQNTVNWNNMTETPDKNILLEDKDMKDEYATVKKKDSVTEKIREADIDSKKEDSEYQQLLQMYDECINYLKYENAADIDDVTNAIDPDYESIKENGDVIIKEEKSNSGTDIQPETVYKVENEFISNDSMNTVTSEIRSERLRRLSKQLPKIIITQSNTSLNVRRHDDVKLHHFNVSNNINHHNRNDVKSRKMDVTNGYHKKQLAIESESHGRKSLIRRQPGYGDFPKRLVSKRGIENIAVISNVPFEKIRLLNDTFHTLINLRWRWIVSGTIVVHFGIWLVFAVFWYIAALAHYDFSPDPPERTCVTGGHDFLTIFLASVEAQTTIGFGDRAIDEECPESIFLFIMQLILGTGLSGVLTCVVYAKLTRPEKLSRDGVGFSKKAVISMRDGQLCLMMRAWDLNYDHIISSEFTAHFIHTHRTAEGEEVRQRARRLALAARALLLWPVTLVHVIDGGSPLYRCTPARLARHHFEITVSLKGASASMGTFTQSQTSYLPKEVLWGHRFPPVVKYDSYKQKYVIDHKKLDVTEPVDTPCCSAEELSRTPQPKPDTVCPGTPSSFSEMINSFQLERSSSFRKKTTKG